MPFRFVLGRAGSGKTRYCLEAVARELRRGPDGPPLILLVPEQATFQMDRALVSLPGVPGTARAQVLSFRRLALRVMAETGGAARPHIDEVGKVMALRALLSRRQDQLCVFGSCLDSLGFLSRLVRTLGELRAYSIGHQELERACERLAATAQDDTLLAGKLRDLAIISRELEDYLEGRWVDPDDHLAFLAGRLGSRPSCVAGASVWVDGFAGFTARELDVLIALADTVEELSVALCVDPVEARSSGRSGPSAFHPALRTYDALLGRLAQAGVERAEPVVLKGDPPPRFAGSPALAHLERNYPRPVPGPYRGPTPDSDTAPPGLALVVANSRHAEVAAAAREMVRLAREEGYRWRDMSLVARRLEPYAGIIEATLVDYGVPYFIDRRRPVTYHPLVEFARSAVEVAHDDWAPGPLFRLLKTDLWPLPRADVDVLENYVIAHGLRGCRTWTRDEPWRWRRVFALDETAPPDPATEDVLDRVDSLRRQVAALLSPYASRLAGGEEAAGGSPPATFEDRAAALWELVEAAGVPATLERWAGEAIEAGRPDEAQEHEQVLKGFCRVLDQMVTNLGSWPVSTEEFGRTLEAGLATLTLSLVPPSLDQVTVGAIDRSRQPDVRASFVLGVNDGVFPAMHRDDTIFDDRERADLAEGYGLDLAPSSREKALAEDYFAYIALTRASERLWVSHTLADSDGKAMAPSQVVSALKAMFPTSAVTPVSLEPEEATELCAEGEVTTQVTRVLAEARRREGPIGGDSGDGGGHGGGPAGAGGHGPRVPPAVLEAYNWLVKDDLRRQRARAALASLGYRNRSGDLAPELARLLYGKPARVSVSRLERFAACPFSHFASAGLALRPRPRQRLAAPEIGSYYHAVLNLFSRRLAADDLDLAQLDDETVAGRLREAVDEVAPRLESDILASRARYRYLAERLERTVRRTLKVLREHARRGSFRPVGTEMRFVRMPSAGEDVTLRGVVDRVEVARTGTESFVRVIDFKSGGRRYDFGKTHAGLDVQLPAYLLAATAPETEWEEAIAARPGRPVPAGAFFFPVADPYVRAERPLGDEDLERERLTRVRVRGFVLADPDVLRLMDRDIESTGKSRPLLPLTLTASGKARKGEPVVSKQQMRTLLDFTLLKLRSLTASVAAGEIGIRPAFASPGETACRFCDYRPVCRFDLKAGDEYRRLRRLKGDDVWAEMEKEVEKEIEEEMGPGG